MSYPGKVSSLDLASTAYQQKSPYLDLGLFGVWKETMVMKHGDESHGIESLRSPSDWKTFIPLPSATR